MKYSRFTTFLLSTFFASFLYAQPNIPLTFLDQQPIWTHYSYAFDYSRNLQAYLPIENPIISNNDLYLLHVIFNNRNEGYLVEKINLSNGKTAWQDKYYNPNFNRRIFPSMIKQKEKDSLKLLLFREKHPSTDSFNVIGWDKSKFGIIDYCAADGKKYNSTLTDPNDTLNYTLLLNNPLHGNIKESYLFPYKKGVSYINMETKPETKLGDTIVNVIELFQIKLDSLGHPVDSNKISLPITYRVENAKFRNYNTDKYVLFYKALSKSGLKSEVRLIYFDSNLKIEKNIDITPMVQNPKNNFLSYWNEEFILILNVKEITKSGIKYNIAGGTLFNHKGEKIEAFTMSNTELRATDGLKMCILPKTKQVFLSLSTEITTREYIVKNYITDGKSNVRQISTFKLQGDASITHLFPVNDTSILFRYNYIDSTILTETHNPKIPVKWSVWSLFSTTSLGFTTPTTEVAELENFKIFPNPAHNQLNINILENQEMLDLSAFDYQGRLVYQSDLQTTTQINTSEWPKGLYAIVIRNKKGKLQHTSKVIIE